MTIRVNAGTNLYGVMGNPVKHSLSPLMHNAGFSHIGYDGVYTAFEVSDVKSAVSGIRALGIKGVSVTIPHKLSVMDYLDEIDATALKIGAVNTIVNKDGHLYGYNSDCLGAVNALLEKTPIKNQNVVLLGAGGAARAIGFGILNEGGNLTVLNKFEDEGKALADDFGVAYYPLESFETLECDIAINATPLGMTPDITSTPVPERLLSKEMVVMDIVYNPLQTTFLKDAENKGCVTVDGVAMFVYQGVSQFESWTGEKAPVALMRQVVLDHLTSK